MGGALRTIARMRSLVPVLVAALLLTACTGRPEPDATGPEIYSQLCARCHGNDLGGGIGPSLGAGSELADRSDDYLYSVITRGRGSMPAFRTTLDDAQVDRLMQFIRSEQGG